MERNLKVIRKYALGQYQNIEFTDEVTGIPEKLALDGTFVSKLRYLQLLGLEVQLNKYYQMRTKHSNKLPEEVIALLDEERLGTLEEIRKYLTEKGE